MEQKKVKSKDEYSEYNLLSEYGKKCLPSTNYFRVLNGLHEIKVPPSDKHYHKYFDKRCYDIFREDGERIKRNREIFGNRLIPKTGKIENDIQEQKDVIIENSGKNTEMSTKDKKLTENNKTQPKTIENDQIQPKTIENDKPKWKPIQSDVLLDAKKIKKEEKPTKKKKSSGGNQTSLF